MFLGPKNEPTGHRSGVSKFERTEVKEEGREVGLEGVGLALHSRQEVGFPGRRGHFFPKKIFPGRLVFCSV